MNSTVRLRNEPRTVQNVFNLVRDIGQLIPASKSAAFCVHSYRSTERRGQGCPERLFLVRYTGQWIPLFQYLKVACCQKGHWDVNLILGGSVRVSRLGLVVRRSAGKRKDAGSTPAPLRLACLFKDCDLWTLSLDFALAQLTKQ